MFRTLWVISSLLQNIMRFFIIFNYVSAPGYGVCLRAIHYTTYITSSLPVSTVDKKLPHYV